MSKRETGSQEDPVKGTTTSRKSNEKAVKQQNEESTNKRKSNSQQAKHYNGRDARTNRQGGRDSTHSHKTDNGRYKKDTNSTDHHNTKHGGNRTPKEGGSGWHKRSTEGSRGRGHKASSFTKASKPPLEGRDSGISVGDNVSPDSKHGGGEKEGGGTATMEEDTPTDKEVEQLMKEINTSRLVYDRDTLQKYRNSIKSLVTPVGFDKLPAEVAKDILKSSRRHSDSDNKEDNPDGKQDEDGVKHPTTLPFNRDHTGDQKSNVKVSLMPQRRSFGSGCSWRDHQPSTPTKTPTSTADNHKYDESPNGGGWTTVQSGGSHPRVIDHVPYRSRPSHEWKGAGSGSKGSNWRDKANQEVNDEEPEWMSFSPSDKYELMELKGIDEHEMEREARKDELKSMEDRSSLQDESPSSSPLDKDVPKEGGDLVDSGLPSSCPNDDDDGFVLDGFDFKNVLSICHELASDSDDEDMPGAVEKDSLCKAKDSNELKNALISVLGITKEQQQQQQYSMAGKVPSSRKPPQVLGRPLTLDEIEGQGTSQDSIDQSAFNRFLASMATTPSTETSHHNDTTGPSQLIAQQLKQNAFDKSPMGPPSHLSSVTSSTVQQPHPQLPPQHSSDEWVTNTSPVWSTGGGVALPKTTPTTSVSHLLNPSPSSIGIHPPHIRQQQHRHTYSSGGGGVSGNTWVTEMEQVRINELQQMKQQQQQQFREPAPPIRVHQQHLSQQKGSGRVPSLSFLPTSVMRHMHNSKPSPPAKDLRGGVGMYTSKRPDLDYPSSDISSQYMSGESLYHGGSAGGSSSFHRPPHPYHQQHYPYPPSQYTSSGYRRPPGIDVGYHPSGMVPNHPQMSPYMGMGSSAPQPSPY